MSDDAPQDDNSTTLTLRMPRDLRERIDQIAAAEDRNASQVVRVTLRKALGMTEDSNQVESEA